MIIEKGSKVQGPRSKYQLYTHHMKDKSIYNDRVKDRDLHFIINQANILGIQGAIKLLQTYQLEDAAG